MMEAASTSETSVNFYQTTQRYTQKTAIFEIENYSGHRITLSLSYVTERGEGKMERAREGKTAKSLPCQV
jgi:hypothetical protein